MTEWKPIWSTNRSLKLKLIGLQLPAAPHGDWGSISSLQTWPPVSTNTNHLMLWLEPLKKKRLCNTCIHIVYFCTCEIQLIHGVISAVPIKSDVFTAALLRTAIIHGLIFVIWLSLLCCLVSLVTSAMKHLYYSCNRLKQLSEKLLANEEIVKTVVLTLDKFTHAKASY